jgi:alpha-N-arabinofuranosidase
MTHRIHIAIDPDAVVAPVSRSVFGSFVEHMGRGVYTGIFEPGHPRANFEGFRTDVLELVRELGVTAVRYPGGNFVSGYRWEDGVGPVEHRPTRQDLAWESIETNHFGLGEFVRWAKEAGVEPIVVLNLGTRGTREAVELLEYSNLTEGAYSDLRRTNGDPEPYRIKTWCLGNELDGPWQMGHKTADEYGPLAAETARAMRSLYPDLKLILCGSSGYDMPSFGTWDRRVLEYAFDEVDMISAHAYFDPEAVPPEEFLASAEGMALQIEAVLGIADDVARRRGSPKRIGVAFDEWNVWYMGRHQAATASSHGSWIQAPRLSEDSFTVRDAVVVGSLLMTLLRRSDRVELACQAQLVNTIAPIRAEPSGPSWRQPTFHPFSMIARHARGQVLDLEVPSPPVHGGRYGEVPMVQAAATFDPTSAEATIFLVNRSVGNRASVAIDHGAMQRAQAHELVILADDDPDAANTASAPKRVHPRPWDFESDGTITELELPPVSFAMLRLGA